MPFSTKQHSIKINHAQICKSLKTCYDKKENEKVVAKFLESNNNFEILEEKTVFPTPFGGDGFYYALMRKNND